MEVITAGAGTILGDGTDGAGEDTMAVGVTPVIMAGADITTIGIIPVMVIMAETPIITVITEVMPIIEVVEDTTIQIPLRESTHELL